MAPHTPNSGHKPLSTAANLANLLPTGTVLAFQALASSFSNNGSCLPANKYLTTSLIAVCSVICFFSSFTDSFIGHDGKLYYGIATSKGLYILNKDDDDDDDDKEENKTKNLENGQDEKEKHQKDDYNNEAEDVEKREVEKEKHRKPSPKALDTTRYRISLKDFVHAFSSLVVFLVFAISSSDVQRCFFPRQGANGDTLMMNLPLGVGALASLLFMIFPTQRRGIGYADTAIKPCPKCNSHN